MSETRALRVKPAYAAALFTILGLSWFSAPPASAQVGSLIVTITSPSSGSTVGGTIPVNASVSTVGGLPDDARELAAESHAAAQAALGEADGNTTDLELITDFIHTRDS